MTAIVPQAAALVYMRLLLCLQGLYLVFLGWLVFLGRDPGASVRGALAFVLVYSGLGLGEIVTALLLRRGRPGVMVAAIVTEALWIVPVVAGFTRLSAGLGWLFPVFVMFLLTIAGLLLPPVRLSGPGPLAAPGPRGLRDPGRGQSRGGLVAWIVACVRVQVVIEGLLLAGYEWLLALTGQPGVTSVRVVALAVAVAAAGTGLWAAGVAALVFLGDGRRWPLAVLLTLEAVWAAVAVLGAVLGFPPALCWAVGVPPLAAMAGLLVPQVRSGAGLSRRLAVAAGYRNR